MVVSERRGEDRNITHLEADVEAARLRAVEHPLYRSMTSVERVCAFMSIHVFAVWDFMALLKTLQRQLTCVDVPWRPVGDPHVRRLINEIVLGEECDEVGGQVLSHFEMYLAAMDQAGADKRPVQRFLEALDSTGDVPMALALADVAEPAAQFVHSTWDVVARAEPFEVAAVFAFGRENLIPAMFAHVLEGEHCVPLLRDYLIRHIEVDEGVHTPLAMRMVSHLCGDDADRWATARRSVLDAIGARSRMWDGIVARLPHDPVPA
jgi:Protein of unknown function (DUF3050)